MFYPLTCSEFSLQVETGIGSMALQQGKSLWSEIDLNYTTHALQYSLQSH